MEVCCDYRTFLAFLAVVNSSNSPCRQHQYSRIAFRHQHSRVAFALIAHLRHHFVLAHQNNAILSPLKRFCALLGYESSRP